MVMMRKRSGFHVASEVSFVKVQHQRLHTTGRPGPNAWTSRAVDQPRVAGTAALADVGLLANTTSSCWAGLGSKQVESTGVTIADSLVYGMFTYRTSSSFASRDLAFDLIIAIFTCAF